MTELILNELVESIYAVGQEIKSFEKRYGLTSQDFYELFQQGLLDNGDYEETEEFCQWAGLYETRLSREQQFQQLSRKALEQLKKGPGESVQLVPRPQPADA